MNEVQVRAKVKIGKGSLQLWPIGGKLVYKEDCTEPKDNATGTQPTRPGNGKQPKAPSEMAELEKKAKKLHESHIKGVQLTAGVEKKYTGATGDQIDYTSFSPLCWEDLVVSDGPCKPYSSKPVAPFWGVLLSGRRRSDDAPAVNMTARSQHIKMAAPQNYDEITKTVTPTGYCLSLKIDATYLVNTKDLEENDLLVLPYDGGADTIVL